MVKVGVGTEDALELEAIVLQQVGQAAAIELGVARVQQDYVRVVQLIQRQQRRGAHGHIGATQNMTKLHDILYSFFNCWDFFILKKRIAAAGARNGFAMTGHLYSFIIAFGRRKTRAGFCENSIYKRRKIR